MIATSVGLAILVALAVLNFRLSGSVLYPPTHFAVIWAVLLAISLVFADSIFPLSVDAVTVFAIGAVAFSAGGAVRLVFEQRRPREYGSAAPQPVNSAVERLLRAGLIGLVLLFPVYWRYVLSLADQRFSNIWWAIRSGSIAQSEFQGQKPIEQLFFDNVAVAAILLALAAMTHLGERGSSRLVAFGLIATATAYNMATGSRAGAAMVLMGAWGIQMMKRGRFFWRYVVVGLLGALLMYLPIALLRMTKSGDVGSMAASDMRVVGDTAILYTVGPLVSFDAYLQNPSSLDETWSISFFFLRAANRLGLDVHAPSTHLGYVSVGQAGASNVYTMYLAYYADFGMAGVILLSAIVGYGLVWLYSAASSRGSYLLILYGLAFNEICKSGFNEGFFNGLNTWIKAGLFCAALYGLQRISSSTVTTGRPERLSVCCE